MLWKVSYIAGVALTIPFAILGAILGLLEILVGAKGTLSFVVSRPFVWAYERRKSQKIRRADSHPVDSSTEEEIIRLRLRQMFEVTKKAAFAGHEESQAKLAAIERMAYKLHVKSLKGDRFAATKLAAMTTDLGDKAVLDLISNGAKQGVYLG